jgi:hypothetical protein
VLRSSKSEVYDQIGVGELSPLAHPTPAYSDVSL